MPWRSWLARLLYTQKVSSSILDGVIQVRFAFSGPGYLWCSFSLSASCGPLLTTKTFSLALQDRLNTLENVRRAGISVCAGGIIGLGEATMDRVGLLHQVCGELGQATGTFGGDSKCADAHCWLCLLAPCCAVCAGQMLTWGLVSRQENSAGAALCLPAPAAGHAARPPRVCAHQRAGGCQGHADAGGPLCNVVSNCTQAGPAPFPRCMWWRLLLGICTVWARCKWP